MSRYLCPSNPINWGHPLNRGLVSEWAVLPLGFGGITLFDIARRNHGTLTNGPTWARDQRPGGTGAILFDGSDDHVQCSNGVGTNFGTGDFSASCWFKFSPSSKGNNNILSCGSGVSGWELLVHNPSVDHNAYFHESGYGTTAIGASPFKWYHLFGTRLAGTSYIYVNGRLENSGASTSNVSSGSSGLRIGNAWYGGATAKGLVDGVTIHNRGFTASEVYQFYTESRLGNPSRWNYIDRTIYFLPQLPLQTIGEIDFTSSVTSVRTSGSSEVSINWSHPLNRGLVSEWAVQQKGFGGSRLIDLAGKNHATLNGNPSWRGDQHVGGKGSIRYDGSDDYANCGSNFNAGLGAFTVSFWVKYATLGSNPAAVGRYKSGARVWTFLIDTYQTFTVYDETNNAYMQRLGFSPSTDVWYHVVGTYRGGTSVSGVAVFKNGVSISNGTNVGGTFSQLRSNSTSLVIGAEGPDFVFKSSAFIDEVAIWDRELSDSEVAALYSESLRGNPTRWLRPNRSIVPVLQTIPTPSITMGATVQVRPVSSEVSINRNSPLNRNLVLEWTVANQIYSSFGYYDATYKVGRAMLGPKLYISGSSASSSVSGSGRTGGAGKFTFSSNGDRLETFDSCRGASSTTKATFAAWVRPNFGGTFTTYAPIIESRHASQFLGLLISGHASRSLTLSWNGTAAEYDANTGVSLTEDKWSFVAGTVDGTSLKIYAITDGVLSTGTITITSTNRDMSGVWYSGWDSAAGFGWKGDVDSVLVWSDRALDQPAIIEVYRQTLFGNPTRWLRRTTPHLPIVLPAPFVDTGGGTTYTQNVAGSVTVAGSLVKLVMKALAGGSTAVGVLAKVTLKPFAGTSTATGVLTKQGNKALSGSSTSTGSLANAASKSLAGSSTTTGTIAKAVAKPLAGSSTSTGALSNVKVALTTLTGSVTGAGTMAKQANKGTSGSSSPSGGEAHAVSRSLAGSTTPTGTIAKQANKFVSGSAAPAGSLTTSSAATISLSGTVTAVGSFVKSVLKSLLGYVTSSGSLTTSGGTPGTFADEGDIVTGGESKRIVGGGESRRIV